MSTSARALGLALALALASPTVQAADQLKIGEGRGSIEFGIGDSKIFRTTGGFTQWRGKVSVDEADVSRSSVEVEINTGSIQMLDSQQTAMLKDSDFFDVEKFPQMTFKSTRIERTGPNSLKVEGNVTLRGITRPMTLDVTVSERRPDAAPGSRYARFRGFGTIKRSEFGMTKYVDMVGDTVELAINADAWR
jgi:polyisoprenoid-binding protein YceI